MRYPVGIGDPNASEWQYVPANQAGPPVFDVGFFGPARKGWQLCLGRFLSHVDHCGHPYYLPTIRVDFADPFALRLTVQPWAPWPYGRLDLCLPLSFNTLSTPLIHWHRWGAEEN